VVVVVVVVVIGVVRHSRYHRCRNS